jgi:hypothetical protein
VDVARWLEAAKADAVRRGLAETAALLETLAAATRQLRVAPWNERADRDP